LIVLLLSGVVLDPSTPIEDLILAALRGD